MQTIVPSVPSVVPLPTLINDREYYNSKDLQAFKPEFYYGCTSKPRNIITKKNIPESDYIYATFEKLTKKWNLSNDTCKKAQLLISKQWVDANYFKSSSIVIKKKPVLAQQKQGQQEELPQFTTPPPPPPNRELEAFAAYRKEDEDEIVEEEEQEQQKVENAPPILYLDDSEKFHDADGSVIEIETRGERDRKKIYFKVKDVSVGFGMPSLSRNILNINGLDRGIHYTTFKRDFTLHSMECKIANKPFKTSLYLTYKGLLRVLFVSRNKNVDKFQDWAEEKIFTIQMGTRDQKVKLGAEILNTSPRTLKAIFDKYAANFPSIYLMSLGKVRELRETFGIPVDKPDDSIVYKFGFTDDLARRVIELESEYSKLPGVTMTIGTFQIIDTKYTSEAESEVRETCSAFEVRVKKTEHGYNELVALDDKQFANIKKLYRRIGDEFAGATRGLQNQIIELKDQMKEYENENARLKMTIQHMDELHQKDVEWYKKDGELKDTVIELKDTVIENWKLKHQISTTAMVKNGGMITC